MRWFGLRESRGKTHIKLVILSHLGHQLASDPFLHLGPTFLIHPSLLDDSLDDPFRFALLAQDKAETSIVGQSPESKVDGKEPAGGSEGEREEEDELKAEEGQGEDVDVLFNGSKRGLADEAAVRV